MSDGSRGLETKPDISHPKASNIKLDKMCLGFKDSKYQRRPLQRLFPSVPFQEFQSSIHSDIDIQTDHCKILTFNILMVI